jgi:type I restriction enzyme R subunit
MLKEAGCIVQSKNEVDLGAGRGVAVREYQAASGFADYVLFVDKKPVGIIEAKKEASIRRVRAAALRMSNKRETLSRSDQR